MHRVTKEEKSLREQNHQLQIQNWNLQYQVGQAVRFWTSLREGEGRKGKTWTKAQLLSGHTPVVYIRDDQGVNVGCVSLSHVEAIIVEAEHAHSR